MAMFAVKKAAWDALSAEEKAFISNSPDAVVLGTPVLYEDAGAQQWYTFSSINLELQDVALVGAVDIANVTYVAPQDIIDALPPDADVDPFEEVIEGQGNAGNYTARIAIPDDWTLVP